jgi:hypothetical protein
MLQLLSARRRTDLHGRDASWQFDLGAGWSRLWPTSAPAQRMGVRVALSIPDLRGVEVAPALEWRYGDERTLNLAAGPLWRMDDSLQGGGGYRIEVGVSLGDPNTVRAWTFTFGVSHSVLGRRELAVTFGLRFELLLRRQGASRRALSGSSR